MSRAILYGLAASVGAVVGFVVINSALWFHPLPLALSRVVVALRSALAGG